MILVQLIEDLKGELIQLFKTNNMYETKQEITKEPRVIDGWYTVKKKKDKEEEEFPYILISPVEMEDNKDDSSAQLLIIFAAHSEAEDGWKDAALMAEKVRQYLRTHHTICEKYVIDRNIKIIFPDEQPYPQWFCWMNVKFEMYDLYMEEVKYE